MMHGNQDSISPAIGARSASPGASQAGADPISIWTRELAQLSAVLCAHSHDALLDERSEAYAAFRKAVRCVVADARSSDPLPIERLIVMLRAWWRGQATRRRRGDESLRDALWDQLLRMCIADYFADEERV
jgi:hypothetical protein